MSNLSAGDYIVAIGSRDLTETDAKNGSYWTDDFGESHFYNILVTICP